jgi:hypothetical protein
LVQRRLSEDFPTLADLVGLAVQGRLPSPSIPEPTLIIPDFAMLGSAIDHLLTGW